MIDLGKGISDYEDDTTVQFLFEEPYHYHRIFEDDYHIVSGRKGTGKSTIVDYQSIISKSQNNTVIVIRPQVGDELYDTIKYIAQSHENHVKNERQNIAKLLEFIIFTTLMRHFIEGKEDKLLTGELAAVYDFLTANKMIEGSIIRRSLRFLSQITEEYCL